MTTTIYVRATVPQVRAALAGLPAVLAGGGSAGSTIAHGLLLRLGVAALSLCKARFEALSRGGTYEGEQWAPLAPATLAGRRRPKGVPTRFQAIQAVTAAARKLQSTRPGTKSRDRALAAYGRAKTKAATAYAPAQVGVDTGLMRASLSPAVDGPSGDANQVFRLGHGAVAVGTKLHYARWFHEGTRHQPARPLWPDPRAWPASWRTTLGEAARSGAVRAIELLLQGGLS